MAEDAFVSGVASMLTKRDFGRSSVRTYERQRRPHISLASVSHAGAAGTGGRAERGFAGEHTFIRLCDGAGQGFPAVAHVAVKRNVEWVAKPHHCKR